ncbi:MAG: hypothetical protein EXR82_09370 [Gammaproteobacteria bacterium]|nr:hypothetical protein [Gammaproteobacteria bacterium]
MSKARKAKKPYLTAASRPGEPDQQTLARSALQPTLLATLTVQAYSGELHDLDLVSLMDGLGEQVAVAKTGDVTRAEAMLVAQAHSLDAVFHACARRAAGNMGQFVKLADTYLRLALKAQSQCRTTWETLALIKNPPQVAFVKQANIAHGPQQVNNGVQADHPVSPGRETENEPSKLLEATHGERLDTPTTGTAGRTDTQLEAVGAINRAKDTGR